MNFWTVGDQIDSGNIAGGAEVPLRFVIVNLKEAAQPGGMCLTSQIQLSGCKNRAGKEPRLAGLGFCQGDATKGGISQGDEGV